MPAALGETPVALGEATLAGRIAAEVRLAGIRHVFGVPGGEVLALIDALRLAGTEFVLCNHEASAGMMASAYGRLTGAPGVVLSTLGPGAANLLLPIANSQLDREALIAICGDLPASWPLGHTHQRLDLQGIFTPTTKLCAALRPQDGAATLRAALAAASQTPRGACLLTLSAEDATAPANAGRSPVSPVAQEPAPDRSEALRQDVERIRAELADARRPLVILGCGAEQEAAEPLRSWLARWNLAVALTPKAKGMVREDHPRFLGVLDGAGLGEMMSEALAGADLVLGLGLDPVELIRTWHCDAPVLWVGDCGEEPERPRADRLPSTVAQLAPALAALDAPASWPDWLAASSARRRALLADGSRPTWIARTLRRALPAETIITTDVGSHKCLMSQFLAVDEPGLFLTSNGLSAMGYGLPAVIGAKLARPERPVLAVLGDGGFAMSSQELETAERLGAPIVVVAVLDGSLSLIQLLQQARGLPRCGVDYAPVDVPALARAHGAWGGIASTPAELADAVEDALAREHCSVIAVPVDAAGYRDLL